MWPASGRRACMADRRSDCTSAALWSLVVLLRVLSLRERKDPGEGLGPDPLHFVRLVGNRGTLCAASQAWMQALQPSFSWHLEIDDHSPANLLWLRPLRRVAAGGALLSDGLFRLLAAGKKRKSGQPQEILSRNLHGVLLRQWLAAHCGSSSNMDRRHRRRCGSDRRIALCCGNRGMSSSGSSRTPCR